MWSYDFTSELSLFSDQSRVGALLPSESGAARLAQFLQVLTGQRRCRHLFFDAGVEEGISKEVKALLKDEAHSRKVLTIGLRFPPELDPHQSPQTAAEFVQSFIKVTGVAHIDLVVVGWPVSSKGPRHASSREQQLRDERRFMDTWASLASLVRGGVIKHLGLDGCLQWHIDAVFTQFRERGGGGGSEAEGQAFCKPVANVVKYGPLQQQRSLVNYCHVRHLNVVGVLTLEPDAAPAVEESAEGGEGKGEALTGGGGEQRPEGEEEGGESQPGVQREGAAKQALEGLSADRGMAVGALLARWAMYRGVVPLVGPGLLATLLSWEAQERQLVKQQQAKEPLAGRGKGGRKSGGSSAWTATVTPLVDKLFGVLHSLASRPEFFSPNDTHDSSLTEAQLRSIDALGGDEEEGEGSEEEGGGGEPQGGDR